MKIARIQLINRKATGEVVGVVALAAVPLQRVPMITAKLLRTTPPVASHAPVNNRE